MGAKDKDSYAMLRAAQSKGIDPSLEPVRAMLKELGDPDLDYSCVQVVGTNGKTSTARYTAAILAGEGMRVGLYLSPCLVCYEDQVEIDGHVIDKATLDEVVGAAYGAGVRVNERRAAAGLEPLPNTEFDLLTVAALYAFSLANVDVAILEAGMGAQWDATSASRSIHTSCITGIGLDHTQILGNTVEDIARNKACTVVRGRKLVLGRGATQDQKARDVILARCADQGVSPTAVLNEDDATIDGVSSEARYRITHMPEGIGDPMELSVRTSMAEYSGIRAQKPAYQAQNIACAIALAQAVMGRAPDPNVLATAVRDCRTPGRFELLRKDPPILVDACHNPQSVQAFLHAVSDAMPYKEQRPVLLCAIFADKDVDTMVSMLAKEFPRVVVTQTDSPRAMGAQELSRRFEQEGVTPESVTHTVGEAIRLLANESFVACGSITTAGEVARAIANKYEAAVGRDANV